MVQYRLRRAFLYFITTLIEFRSLCEGKNKGCRPETEPNGSSSASVYFRRLHSCYALLKCAAAVADKVKHLEEPNVRVRCTDIPLHPAAIPRHILVAGSCVTSGFVCCAVGGSRSRFLSVAPGSSPQTHQHIPAPVTPLMPTGAPLAAYNCR